MAVDGRELTVLFAAAAAAGPRGQVKVAIQPRGHASQRFRARAEVGRLVDDRNHDATAGSGVNDAGLPDEVAAALGPPAALEGDGVEAAGAEAPALARLDVCMSPGT